MLQSPEIKAGPNQRAGLSAAPVIGPTEKIIAVIVNPIGKPAILATLLLLSTATPKITKSKNAVPITSARKPAPMVVSDAIAGRP